VCNSEKGRVGKSKIHSRFDLFFQFFEKIVESVGKLKINCQTKFSISISMLQKLKNFLIQERMGKGFGKIEGRLEERESC
jgi:hypothetical protein